MKTRGQAVRFLAVLAAASALAWLVLYLNAALWLQSVAAFVLAVAVPGSLLAALLLGDAESPPTPLEWIVYAVALGFGILTLLEMALSYLPGGLALWQTQVGFGVVTLAMAAVVVVRSGRATIEPVESPFADGRLTRRQWWWMLAGLVAVGIVAGFFRFGNIGYAEFHGDESRAVLRAAAVIQGYENVLFIHRKAPGEILVPATVFAYAGRINEAAARLPFALANLVALLGALLLGWRMRSAVAGWAAALLLALDGYLVAFSRFVQYQSVVLLMSVAAVLVAWRLYRDPRSLARYMTVGALFLAVAVLFHWDGLLAWLPVGVLLIAMLVERKVPWARFWRGVLPAAVVGAATLALFFVPYFLQPNYEAAASYLVETRLAGQSPGLRNNIVDIVARTAVYSSIYYIGTLVALAGAALILGWRTGWGRKASWVAAAALVVTLGATIWRADFPTIGGRDWTVLPWLLLIGGLWVAPRLPTAERTLWLWFGLPLIASLFLIAAPRTHVHIFFVPWALVAGLAVAAGWEWIAHRYSSPVAMGVALGGAAAATVLFGGWLYLAFVDARTEMVLNWTTAKPRFYWTPAASDTIDAKYGFPLNNGWKTPAALYADGTMSGDYDVLLWADYISWWYLRDQWRCYSTSDWYFTVRGLEPWAEPPEDVYGRVEEQGFRQWGDVDVMGHPGMRLFAREGIETEQPATMNPDAYESAFDAAADPYLRLSFPAVEPPAPNRLDANFGNKLTLEGYDLEYEEPLRPGDTLALTLYWRGQVRIGESYKVSNQMYDDRGNFAAQVDAVPVCDRRETNRWRPGEEIIDRHTLTINEGTPPGIYPLYTVLYRADTGERMPLMDAAGQPVDDKLKITELEIGAPAD